MFYKEYNNSPNRRSVGTIVNNLQHYESAPHFTMDAPSAWVLLGGAGSAFTFAEGKLKFTGGCTSIGDSFELDYRDIANKFTVNTCKEDVKKVIRLTVPTEFDCNTRYVAFKAVWRETDSDSRFGAYNYTVSLAKNCNQDPTPAQVAQQLADKINVETTSYMPKLVATVSGREVTVTSEEQKEFWIDATENLTQQLITPYSSEVFKGKDLDSWGVTCNPFAANACLRILTIDYFEKVWVDGHSISSSSQAVPHGHYLTVKKTLAIVSNDTGAAKTQYDAIARVLRGEDTPASKYYAVANVPASPTPVPTPV